MLGRMMDKLMVELSEDDLDDLYSRVEAERNRRFLASRRRSPHEDEEGTP
jgi:hypothetical protein